MPPIPMTISLTALGISNQYPVGNNTGDNAPIPPSPLSKRNSASLESRNCEIEKLEEPDEEDEGENEWPIIYHYLTYETELPIPSPSARDAGNSLPPEYPNLTEYQNPFEWKKSRKRW